MYLVSIQLINLCYLNIIGKDLSLIDKLMKGYVLKIFITGDICHFALLVLLMSSEIGQNSYLRHAIENYVELSE